MEFCILIFEDLEQLNQFSRKTNQLNIEGIETQQFGESNLLISKSHHVQPEDWGRFQSAGFNAVCGNWAPTWYETNQIRNGIASELKSNGIPFILAFWGDNSSVISNENGIT